MFVNKRKVTRLWNYMRTNTHMAWSPTSPAILWETSLRLSTDRAILPSCSSWCASCLARCCEKNSLSDWSSCVAPNVDVSGEPAPKSGCWRKRERVQTNCWNSFYTRFYRSEIPSFCLQLWGEKKHQRRIGVQSNPLGVGTGGHQTESQRAMWKQELILLLDRQPFVSMGNVCVSLEELNLYCSNSFSWKTASFIVKTSSVCFYENIVFIKTPLDERIFF